MEHVINYSLEKRRPIDIIYMKGMEITQRRIRVIKNENNIIKAIDTDRGVIRSFKKDFILSAMHRVTFDYNVMKTEIHNQKNKQ